MAFKVDDFVRVVDRASPYYNRLGFVTFCDYSRNGVLRGYEVSIDGRKVGSFFDGHSLEKVGGV